jgi:hypothetical protein
MGFEFEHLRKIKFIFETNLGLEASWVLLMKNVNQGASWVLLMKKPEVKMSRKGFVEI